MVYHRRVLTVALTTLSALIVVFASRKPVALAQDATTTPIPGSVTVAQYGLFETEFPFETTAKNVFDPDQVDITAQFNAPDGSRFIVPAFWMQSYEQTCTQNCAEEALRATGESGWRVRFTPSQPGNWTYTIDSHEPGGIRTLTQGQFTVAPSKNPGFIRVGKNHHYFGYDNGTPYFPVGGNLGWSWSGVGGTLGYQNWLKKLNEVGANYGRLYINVPWFIGLDWKTPHGDYVFAQEDAWRLDTILHTAEEQGIALQLVLLWNQGFTTFTGLPVNPPPTPRADTRADWSNNPLNILLGGPFNSSSLYFATDQGKALFKRSMRHIIARWGYSSSVFAWEIIDQLDRVGTTIPDTMSEWIREMVNYLRQTDPYKHLITAGLRDISKASLLERAVLDFRQARYYQRRPVELAIDQVSGTLNTLSPLLSNADRPVLVNEFSLNPWFEPTADDPTGIHVYQTMWATALSGAAGGAASWWWDTYLFPQNLVSGFAPLAAFTRGIPWNTADLTPVSVSLAGDASLDYQPLRIAGYNGTFGAVKAPDLTYRVTADGVVPPITSASSFLYGVTYSTQFSQPHKYVIAPPTDTKLTVHIRRVSDRAPARLVIIVDGKTVGEMALSPRSEPASLTVPISAGEHTVVLDNLGDDFLQIDSVEIAQYITPLRAIALADRNLGIFLAWFQHRDYTWQNVAKNANVKPVTVSLRVSGMPPGMYRLEFWDPFSGNVVGQEEITIPGQKDGILTASLLPVSKSIAVRAIRVAEPANAPSPTPTPTPTPRILSTPVTTATPSP